MSALLRRFILLAAVAAALAVPVTGFASDGSADRSNPATVIAKGEANDDLVPVALGTLAAVGAAGVVVSIGYLYRRLAGKTGHYEDGFTPRDPRDHATH